MTDIVIPENTTSIQGFLLHLESNNLSLLDTVPESLRYLVHSHWRHFSPPDTSWNYLLGMVYSVLGLFTILSNGLVIYTFSTAKILRNPANVLVVNLASSDLLMGLSQCPLLVINCFTEKWIFGPATCKIYGFFGALSGITSIMTLALISLDRYYVIVCPFSGKKLTYPRARWWVAGVWVYSLTWTVMPFTGWNNYVLEGFLTSCTIDYLSEDWTSRSFVITIFIAAYVLPLSIIIFCYTKIIYSVRQHEIHIKKQAKKMNISELQMNRKASKQSLEFRLAKVSLIVILLWVMAWTPYATVVLIAAFGDRNLITPHVASLPALFAKLSSTYNPIVYAISHPKYREELRIRLVRLCGSSAADEVSAFRHTGSQYSLSTSLPLRERRSIGSRSSIPESTCTNTMSSCPGSPSIESIAD